MTERLERRIRRDFRDDAPYVLEQLRLYRPYLGEKQDRERLEAAVVLLSQGDLSRFERALTFDWRDACVWSGMGGNWHPVLDRELGPG